MDVTWTPTSTRDLSRLPAMVATAVVEFIYGRLCSPAIAAGQRPSMPPRTIWRAACAAHVPAEYWASPGLPPVLPRNLRAKEMTMMLPNKMPKYSQAHMSCLSTKVHCSNNEPTVPEIRHDERFTNREIFGWMVLSPQESVD